MKAQSLGFIGGGRITRIFLQAFTNKGEEFNKVVVFDINAEAVNTLKQQFPQVEIAGTIGQAASQPIVFIALHPPVIMDTLDKVADSISKDAIVISLAPKISMEKMISRLKTANLARMIPNATSYINEGYNPVTFAPGFDESLKTGLIALLGLLGRTLEVAEPKLEAYALLSAMLPTYFWFQWNELGKLGVQMGLSEEESSASVQQTVAAASDMMYKSGLSPAELMDLIPVKPIGEHQAQIAEIYQTKLMGLYEKIKP